MVSDRDNDNYLPIAHCRPLTESSFDAISTSEAAEPSSNLVGAIRPSRLRLLRRRVKTLVGRMVTYHQTYTSGVVVRIRATRAGQLGL